MSGFTFLTAEQCSENMLEILRKRGLSTNGTDFSLLLGESLMGAWYWLRDKNGVVTENGSLVGIPHHSHKTGSRPVIEFSSIDDIPTNGELPKKARDGVLEVEYGYYPQKAAPLDMQQRLERAFETGKMSISRNSYTTDSTFFYSIDFSTNPFQPQHFQEYEFEGRKFIRFETEHHSIPLSGGYGYGEDGYVWVEVLPIRWLVDEREHLMVSEQTLFAGVQFDREEQGTDFEQSDIKRFMDSYFAREIEQNMIVQQRRVERRRGKENPFNLDFTETDEEETIRAAIEGNVAIFLHGKPGSGKSDRVRQLDPDFVELNLSHLDPELLDGLAGEKDGKEVHIKPPWLEELEAKCEAEPDRIHILFLEELTNASGVMQSKAYGIVLDKKVAGRWKLPENARVVAAGNEIEDSLVANEMAEPLYGRFAHVNIETRVEDWLEWAVMPEETYEGIEYHKEGEEKRPKIHPAIYAYISYRGEEVLRTPYDREHPRPYADPRRWKMASDMLYASNNPNTLVAIVGEEITRDFIFFCKLPTITIEDVINGNYTQEEVERMDLGTKLATVSGLVRVDEERMPAVREFIKKLGEEMRRTFEAQWAHGDKKRLELLQEISMIEEEEEARRAHRGEEAKGTAEQGVVAYTLIDGAYGEHNNPRSNGDELGERGENDE